MLYVNECKALDLVLKNPDNRLSPDEYDYRILKQSMDKLNEQMNRFNEFYINQMNEKIAALLSDLNSLATTLHSLQEKAHVLESSFQQFDALAHRMNGIDQTLDQPKIIQGKNVSIDNTSFDTKNLEQMNRRYNNTNAISEDEHDEEKTFIDSNPTCETKIDHVISFISSFAEINRLESSDILSRLTSIQSQLISFFDREQVTIKSSIKSNTHAIKPNFDENKSSEVESTFSSTEWPYEQNKDVLGQPEVKVSIIVIASLLSST